MASIPIKTLIFYISIPIALIMLIISGVYITEKVNPNLQKNDQIENQLNINQKDIQLSTPLINLDYKVNKTIKYQRDEQVIVNMGSSQTILNNQQNLTFYVLDQVKDQYTSLILQLDDAQESKSDYFAFSISSTGSVTLFQYSATTSDTTLQLARSSIYQFSPSLIKSLFNKDAAPVYEKMGDMYVHFNRNYSDFTLDSIQVSRSFEPKDILNSSSSSKNFTFSEQTIFNKTDGLMISSKLQQTYFIDNQFSSPLPGTGYNVSPSLNLTTVVIIQKLSETSEFLQCQQALFSFKMQGSLITDNDILSTSSASKISGNSRLLEANTTVNANTNTSSKPKYQPNITSLKNISLFEKDLFGCKLGLVFQLDQQQLPTKGRFLYIFSLNIILGQKRRQVFQKRLFTASPDMTPSKTKSRILGLLGLSNQTQTKQQQLRNLVKFDVDEVFEMPQIVTPKTNLNVKLIINSDFAYKLDILSFIEAVENQVVDPITNQLYNKSVLTTAWKKLEDRMFNSTFDVNLNISMQASFRMKVPGGNIVLNSTANLLNATARLNLCQQFKSQIYSIDFVYSVIYGKIQLITYLVTRSCKNKICTELSQQQSSFTLFDDVNEKNETKIEKIKDKENQESDDNEDNEDENNNGNTENSEETEEEKEQEKKEEAEINSTSTGQTELNPIFEESNQKKKCDITDEQCYSNSPCGCKNFSTLQSNSTCPNYKKGLENGCDLSEPYVDFEFIRCQINSCKAPYIQINKDTCQAKSDNYFKIGMDIEIPELDYDLVNEQVNKSGIKSNNIQHLIGNFSHQKGMNNPNLINISSINLSDEETNFLNEYYINQSISNIASYYDSLSFKASQNNSIEFLSLPRSIRTTLFYFYYQNSEQDIKDNTFLSQINNFFLLQNWKGSIDYCYQEQSSCEKNKLYSAITLLRYACTMCDKTTKVQADIVMIMDASGSVSSPDFEKERQFVYDMSKSLMENNSLVNIGIIQFSSTSTIESYLSNNQATVLNKINTLPKISGSTHTDLAFEDAYSIFTKSNDTMVKKILFVLTDGGSNGGNWTNILAKLKNFGVNIYSVGIGSGINQKELDTFATQLDNVFLVSNFSILYKIQSTLQKETCFGTIPMNSTFQEVEVIQKAGTYSYFAFEYDPNEGKTITIDINPPNTTPNTNNSNTIPSTSSSSIPSTSSSSIPSTSSSSSSSENSQQNNKTENNTKKVKAYYSETETNPNEFNNDGVGYQDEDGKIKISKEKDHYNSSYNSNSKNKRVLQTSLSKKLYVSIVSTIDTLLKIAQQNTTTQIIPCQTNCSVCNAMGNICYQCENSTFLYNQKCYFQNEKLNLFVLQQNTQQVNQIQFLQQEGKEEKKVNTIAMVGLIMFSLYLVGSIGYILYTRFFIKKIYPINLNTTFDEKSTQVVNNSQCPINQQIEKQQNSYPIEILTKQIQ